MADAPRTGGFGLYVHWPFCQAKCPYCDFNSHVVAGVDQSRWARALASEIARSAEETGPRVLDSIFFGGGTPSLMHPDTVAAVIDAARAAWGFSNSIEVTLEANPTSVESGRFAGYKDAGVNRVSMGVQALNDADLKRLGRLHTAAEARAAFDIARRAFDRVSFDLIYARQDQTAADWNAELSDALSMALDHLSLYQLTIEDGTAFGERFAAGRLRGLPDENRAIDLWDVTQEKCAVYDMPAYEVSNHARPGAESIHNLIYWRGGDYVGVGPGAHGRLTIGPNRTATEAVRLPGKWIDQVERTGRGEKSREDLSRDDRLSETLLMHLRLREGVPVSKLVDLGWDLGRAGPLVEAGLVEIQSDRLRATDAGWPLLNALIRELLGD